LPNSIPLRAHWPPAPIRAASAVFQLTESAGAFVYFPRTAGSRIGEIDNKGYCEWRGRCGLLSKLLKFQHKQAM